MSVYITLGDPSGCMGAEFIDSDKHPDNIAIAQKAKSIAAKAARKQGGRSMSSSWETIDTFTTAAAVKPAQPEPPLIYVPGPNEGIMDILRSVFRLHTQR